MSIAQAELTGIVEDNNGKYWLCAMNYPMIMNSGDVTSGTAYTDANQYSITLSASDLELALEIPKDVYTALVSTTNTTTNNGTQNNGTQNNGGTQGGGTQGSGSDLEG